MTGILQPRAALAILASLCALALLGSTLVIAGDNPLDCPPPETPYSNATPHGSACYQAAIATHQAKEALGRTPETSLFDYYNRHPEKLKELSVPETPADYAQAESIEPVARNASHSGLARIFSVEFRPNVMGYPMTLVTYEVLEPIKGVSRGQRLREQVPGGPDRMDDGEVVLFALPRRGLDLRGDLVLVFMEPYDSREFPGDEVFMSADVTVRFRVDNKGNIIDDENARALNLSGKPVAGLIAELRAATN